MRELQPFGDEMKPRFARWCIDHIESLGGREPDVPAILDDRASEIAEPLLTIADEVGGDWPKRARDAVIALLANRDTDDDSLATMLLADIRELFFRLETDRFASSGLAKLLAEMTDRPWASFGKAAKAITPAQIANLLKPFRIASGTVRGGAKTYKGSLLKDFEDTFARILDNRDPEADA